jgi:hypothetical protein
MSIDNLNRDALVVGICQYDTLRMSEELTKLSDQAEQLAQLLAKNCNFRISRLPCSSEIQLDLRHTQVTISDLERAIEQRFYPPNQSPTDIALLFFAGHGLYKETRISKEGFLATSEADNKSVYGVSYQWLAKILCNSPVKQQIVFIEACHSGAFLEAIEEEKKKGCFKNKDICFITSARADEEALAKSTLIEDLLDILGKNNISDSMLIEELKKRDKNRQTEANQSWQRPQFRKEGKSILITQKASIEKSKKSPIPLFLTFGIIVFILAFLYINKNINKPNEQTSQATTFVASNVLSNNMFYDQEVKKWIDFEKQENANELAKQNAVVKKEKSIPEQLKMLEKETGIVISQPTQKTEWITNHNLPMTNGTYHVIVTTPSNENMGNKKIEELTKKYPYVNFTLHNTESTGGKNKRLAIFIGHGLTQDHAKKLVSWTKKVGIAKDAYSVQNIWNESVLVASLEMDTSNQNISNKASNPEATQKANSIEIVKSPSDESPKGETLIAEDFPTTRENWKAKYHRDLESNSRNVLIKSITVKSNDKDKANNEAQDVISKLSQTYLNVYFDSYETEDKNGNTRHIAIFIGSGLTQIEAKKLKLWAIKEGIASDVFIVKNKDDQDDSEEN